MSWTEYDSNGRRFESQSKQASADRIIAAIEDMHALLMACRHTTTFTVTRPDTEDDNGTVLDGEPEKYCLDCGEYLGDGL